MTEIIIRPKRKQRQITVKYEIGNIAYCCDGLNELAS